MSINKSVQKIVQQEVALHVIAQCLSLAQYDEPPLNGGGSSVLDTILMFVT